MRKIHISLIIILILSAVGGAYYWNNRLNAPAEPDANAGASVLNKNSGTINETPDVEAPAIDSNEQKNEQVSLVIDFGNGHREQIVLAFAPGITAFSLLTEGAKQKGLSVQTKTSSAGAYVDSIGGLAGGTDGKYWLYYLNGEQAPTAADKLELKTGDRVDWKFEQPSF